MAILTSQQRNTLEKAVIKARNIAEEGALNSLRNLAVDQPEPFSHQSPEQRFLRNNLRAKSRLLGDTKLHNGSHEIQNLSYELAYEYWHKILFARFLEANNLLVHPEMGVAVTMEEIEELAPEEGYTDKWDAATTYASKMLPAIFRVDDPLMQIIFAPNDRIALESILKALEPEIFTADDALGWVYQFWQTEAKKAINDSGDKIDGKRLPAVTQLFTEPYMVNFLIDNTLGAWWVSRNPRVTPPVKFEYLRLLEDGKPAAGVFEGWPDKTSEITSMDPSMGSGHFIASLFLVFAQLRIYEEGLTKEEATDQVIIENLHGLELDPRCTQLAAFNLAFTAWKFCGHYKVLPEMNLACCGIAPKGKVEDWLKLVNKVENDNDTFRFENGMRALYEHFQLAPELGSLLDPSSIKPDLETASFEQLQPVLKKALENEKDKDVIERGVMASGIAKAGEMLSKKYSLQISNVPYLSRGKQDAVIADYCEKNYKEAKGNLAFAFLLKMLKISDKNGIVANVTLQDWLFQPTNKKLRHVLLVNESWSLIAKLGARGFQTPMYDFNVILLIIQHSKPDKYQQISGTDVSSSTNPSKKGNALLHSHFELINQLNQLKNPDYRIIIGTENESVLLSNYSDSLVGLQTSDDLMFVVTFWEVDEINKLVWEYLQNTPLVNRIDSGMSFLVRWEQGKGLLLSLPTAYPTKGLKALGKHGIALNRMGEIFPYLYAKERFHQNVAVLVPHDVTNLPSIWCFCTSDEFNEEVRKIDQSLKVTNATLVKVPFDKDYWESIAINKFPKGLPKPYSDDPTQWLFHGHPVKAENALQIAVARLLGYRWPAECDKEMELSEEARQLIRQVKALDLPYDEDGIVCIPSMYNEHPGAERLRALLQKAWGDNWSNNVLADLLKQAGSSKNNLEDWLRDEFFANHCKVFQNHPFIWNIWDGRKDGFSALVNYHKLDKETLKKLIYTYLGDWIRRCEAKRKAGESGADGLLNAALKLKEKLELILVGDKPYDIFIRWKPIEQQPIGWEPDLNDGVRLNIRPFVEAGVLRSRFNIKWGIDRGKNPAGSPWGEIRDNDRHLTLEEKRLAKEANKQ